MVIILFHVYVAIEIMLKTKYKYMQSVIHFNVQYIVDIHPLAWFNIKIISNYIDL